MPESTLDAIRDENSVEHNDSLNEEIIDSSLLEIFLKEILRQHFTGNDVGEEIDKVDGLVTSIYEQIEENISIGSVKKIGIENNYVKVYYNEWEGNKVLYFHIPKSWEEQEIVGPENIEETRNTLRDDLAAYENILNAMDWIFTENKKEFFEYLDEKDVLKTRRFWKELYGMSIKELQLRARSMSSWVKQTREAIPEDDIALDIKLQEQQKRYLHFIVWIWGKYEWGAKLFEKSKSEIKYLVWELVSSHGSIDSLLSYLVETHTKIDKNNFQSKSVETSYKAFSTELHKSIFSRMQDENASDEELLDFAKIITGRFWDIDNRLKDPDLSNKIILHIFQQEWWIMDKINSSGQIEIEDEIVWATPPKDIVDTAIVKLKNVGWEKLLERIWFGDTLKINKWDDYQELGLEEKIKISTLARLLDKAWEWDIENTEKLEQLFLTVAQEANKAVVEWLNDNFDASWGDWNGKNSKDFWLVWVQAEVFDLYNDINGNWNGLFNFSDGTDAFLLGWVKMAAVITIAIAAGFAAWPILGVGAIGAWVTVWVTASIASMGVNPKWYDTLEEAMVDITTDLVVWWATWAAWWYVVRWLWWLPLQKAFAMRWVQLNNARPFWIWRLLTSGWWVEWAKMLSKWWAKNASVFLWDLALLWFVIEWKRMQEVDKIFHSDSIFTDQNAWSSTNNYTSATPTQGNIPVDDDENIVSFNEKSIREDFLSLAAFRKTLEDKPFKLADFKADKKAVRSLQKFLKIETDGVFGKITFSKVQEFQKKHKDENGIDLKDDGLPGEKTLTTIINKYWLI